MPLVAPSATLKCDPVTSREVSDRRVSLSEAGEDRPSSALRNKTVHIFSWSSPLFPGDDCSRSKTRPNLYCGRNDLFPGSIMPRLTSRPKA